MTQSNIALSRFKTSESAARAPGSCLTCKSSNGPFMDPGIQLFSHGQVYLCVNCVSEMAFNLGLLDPLPPVEIKPNLDEANEIVNNYLASVSGLSDLLVAAHGALSGILNETAQQGEEPANTDSDKLPESVSSEGSAGVSSDSSDELPRLDSSGLGL